MEQFFNKRRAAFGLVLVLLVSSLSGVFTFAAGPTFSDVQPNHWACSYVERAAEHG